MATSLAEIYALVDKHQDRFVKRLADAVAIPSVSGEPERRNRVFEMGDFIKTLIEAVGGTVIMRDLGQQPRTDGLVLRLPFVILGQIGNDPKKRTVCVYGHYDVQPASKEDGWNTDPFVLTEINGKMYGRGSSDDKGPALGWICVAEMYRELGLELPVNLKFIYEGMEESGSVGMDALIHAESKAGGFLEGVDYFCISDNYWLGTQKPCLTYGLRGLAYFFLTITGPCKDLHSGVYGGTVHEPMTDLFAIMSTLVAPNGKILVPGIEDQVAPVTAEEFQLYKAIDWNHEEMREDTKVARLMHDSKEDLLMHRWRYPTLSIHGIEGAHHSAGPKTVIPAKVTGKFSIRLVPDMTPAVVETLVKKHVHDQFAKLGSPNKCEVLLEHGARPWVRSPNDPNFVAGSKATQRVYGTVPDFTREGGSIPITLTFEEATGKSCLLLPMGCGDDGAHSQNEKLDRRNFIEGIKLLATYLDEISQLP